MKSLSANTTSSHTRSSQKRKRARLSTFKVLARESRSWGGARSNGSESESYTNKDSRGNNIRMRTLDPAPRNERYSPVTKPNVREPPPKKEPVSQSGSSKNGSTGFLSPSTVKRLLENDQSEPPPSANTGSLSPSKVKSLQDYSPNEPIPSANSTSSGLKSSKSLSPSTVRSLQKYSPNEPIPSANSTSSGLKSSRSLSPSTVKSLQQYSPNEAIPSANTIPSPLPGSIFIGDPEPADSSQSVANTTPGFLPPQLAADIATDRGSTEFIMDSEFRWAQDNYSSFQRTVEIWTFLITLRVRLYLIEQKWTYFTGYSEEVKSQRRRNLASWCLDQILELGPTFIKLGQLFSTRSDLFPAEYTEELSKLQDRVPAFSSTKAIDIIEKELGDSVTYLFDTFDTRPIAAASLGQVHRATLYSGEEVVVKVQRPGLRKLFNIDMDNMGRLAAFLDRTDPNQDNKGIYKECRTILFQEIDYINEGKNADRFRRNFRPYDWVKIPAVKWQYTSPSVITLEYLPGIKISSVARLVESGLDVRDIAVKSTEAYIIQVLKHGFLHSDPHSGKLIWYDFGMMSEIAPYTKDRLLQLFYAIAQQDADAVIKSLTDLGIIVPTSDTLSLKRAISFFLDNVNKQAQKEETLSAIGEDLFSLAGKLLVGKDEYSFAAIAKPYAQELLDRESTRQYTLQQVSRQAVDFSVDAAQVPGRVSKLEKFAKELEDGTLKLRVRDSANERALRRSRIMQTMTFQSIAVAGLLNVGVQLQLADKIFESYPAYGGAAFIALAIAFGFRRVKKLDSFEKQIRR